MWLAHNAQGHFDSRVTLLNLHGFVKWHNMDVSVNDYCALCINCARNNGAKATRVPLGAHDIPTAPGHTVLIDFLFIGKSVPV
jgi:hypothetical protein